MNNTEPTSIFDHLEAYKQQNPVIEETMQIYRETMPIYEESMRALRLYDLALYQPHIYTSTSTVALPEKSDATEPLKRCKRCWKLKRLGRHPHSDFYKVKHSRDGLSTNCKRCTIQIKKAKKRGTK